MHDSQILEVHPRDLRAGDVFISGGRMHYTITEDAAVVDGLVVVQIEWRDGGLGSRTWYETDDVALYVERPS